MPRKLIWLLLTLGGGGCVTPVVDQEQPSGLVTYEGVIEYRSPENATICEGAPRLAAEAVERLSRLFAEPSPNITYIFEPSVDWPAGHVCPPGSRGCAVGTTIYSHEFVHPHELVHGWLEDDDATPALLREGTATALGFNAVDLPPTAPRLEEVMHRSALAGDSAADDVGPLYSSGALLAAHLLREHGPRPFLSFYRAARMGEDVASFREQFEAWSGEPLARVWERAHEEAAPYYCEGTADSTSLATVPSGFAPQLQTKAGTTDSCERPGLASRHFWTVPSSPGHRDEVPLAVWTNYRSVTLYGCDPGFRPRSLYGNTEGVNAVFLSTVPPGRYLASRRAPLEAEPEYFVPQSGAFIGNSCHSVVPQTLASDTEVIRTRLLPGQVLGLRWSEPSTLSFQPFEGDLEHHEWRLCGGCKGGVTCQAIRADAEVRLTEGSHFISVRRLPGAAKERRAMTDGADLGLMLTRIER